MTISIFLQLMYGFCSMAVRWYMRKKSLWAPIIDFFGQGIWIGVIVLDGMYGTILVTAVNLVFAALVYRKWKKDKQRDERTFVVCKAGCTADERDVAEPRYMHRGTHRHMRNHDV